MPDTIADTAVALSLMREALPLLEASGHDKAATHLERAMKELSLELLPKPSPHNDGEDRKEPSG